MIRMLTLMAGICFALASCSSVGDAPATGSGGSGRGGGGQGGWANGGSPGDGTGGLPPRLELCGISVSCENGALKGYYGVNCIQFTGVCELGCRVSNAGASEGDWPDPRDFAQTLCVQPDAGPDAADDTSGDAGTSD